MRSLRRTSSGYTDGYSFGVAGQRRWSRWPDGESTAAVLGFGTVEIRYSSFPTIVTVETATSVCEDVLLEVKYWVDEELATDDTPFGWHTTYRECGAGLPPERFVDRSASPPSNES